MIAVEVKLAGSTATDQVLGITMDQSGLSKLENGQRLVSDIEVVALAKALRVSPLSLLQEHDASRTPEARKDNVI